MFTNMYTNSISRALAIGHIAQMLSYSNNKKLIDIANTLQMTIKDINNIGEPLMVVVADEEHFSNGMLCDFTESGGDLTKCGTDGRNLLHAICSNSKYVSEIKMHLRHIAHELSIVGLKSIINEQDKKGWTPFMYLMKTLNNLDMSNFMNREDSIKAMSVLLEYGTNINVEGYSTLGVFCEGNYKPHSSIIKFLVEQGTNINAIDKNGNTPLHSVALRGNKAIIEYMVEQGGNLNTVNNNGCTPLMVATTYGGYDKLKYLIENTKNFSAKSQENDIIVLIKQLYKDEKSQKTKEELTELIDMINNKKILDVVIKLDENIAFAF